MKIRELFRKPIDRPINGVIKADQRDAESIWQELDEYVVTKQLADYFRRFFDAYLAAGDNPNNSVITDRMGVWVSGFFGSGKSHFIKILSYLLENQEAVDPVSGNTKRAAEFFDETKVKDPLLLADIQRATRGSADVILFNIDAKADSKSDRDVVLQVFLRVFNEKLDSQAMRRISPRWSGISSARAPTRRSSRNLRASMEARGQLSATRSTSCATRSPKPWPLH